MKKLFLVSLFSIFLLPLLLNNDANASNPNLFVSAENSNFINHFEGSMVVEVVIIDNNIRDTDKGKGEARYPGGFSSLTINRVYKL